MVGGLLAPRPKVTPQPRGRSSPYLVVGAVSGRVGGGDATFWGGGGVYSGCGALMLLWVWSGVAQVAVCLCTGGGGRGFRPSVVIDFLCRK